jgi:threo-3-hydroxy-L-aspartate ammonia-lyase
VKLVDAQALAIAVERLSGRVVRTPLLPSARLSDEFGRPVLLKAESLQHTGSFKVRGMFNAALARLASGRALGGLATFSAGNAAAAMAYVARALGIPAVVCMPPGAVEAKIDAVRRYGGEIVFTDDLVGECRRVAADRDFVVVHPFDDPDVIAGQGTAGVELMRDCPEPGLVLVPVGGGGLISGVAAAVRAAATIRTAKVVGVEPATANAMTHALARGAADPPPAKPASIADGLTAPFAGALALAHVQATVDDVVTVGEEAIREAWWSFMDATKLLVEPSAVVGLAALRAGLVPMPAYGPIVLVVSGGNVARSGIATALA